MNNLEGKKTVFLGGGGEERLCQLGEKSSYTHTFVEDVAIFKLM